MSMKPIIVNSFLVASIIGAVMSPAERAKADCDTWISVTATPSSTPAENSDICCVGNGCAWLGFQANVGSNGVGFAEDFYIVSNESTPGYYVDSCAWCSGLSQPVCLQQPAGPFHVTGSGFNGVDTPGTIVTCPSGSITQGTTYAYIPS